MTPDSGQPRKKAAIPFNRAAENYIKDPQDVARAIAAIRARHPDHLSAQEKARAEVEAHFTTYQNVIAPFIDILQKLPQKNGFEFFARADLYQSAKSQQDHIRLWLFYGRASDQSPMSGGTPSVHAVAVAPKTNDPKRRFTHVALSTRPVIEVEMKTEKDGSKSIESRIYTERYVRDNGQAPAGTPSRGGFVGDNQMIEQKQHAALKNILPAIDSWLQKAAPERLAEIRGALGILETPELKDDVSILKPATIRKRPKP